MHETLRTLHSLLLHEEIRDVDCRGRGRAEHDWMGRNTGSWDGACDFAFSHRQGASQDPQPKVAGIFHLSSVSQLLQPIHVYTVISEISRVVTASQT